MYTAILRRVLCTYTIILRRVNRMKIFIFVYIRRLGSLVAQGIGGLYRSCFGTRNRNDNRNDNRNGVGSRGVYCSCLGTQNRNGVRGYCTCFSTQNRNGVGGYCTCFSTRNRYGVGTTVPVLVSKTGTILRVESGVCLSKLAEILSNVYFGISLSMQV